MRNFIILIGAPGSGKGTQALFLKEKKAPLYHLSTGDLLRKAIAENSPLGKEVKELMALGKLVPNKLIIDIVDEKIASLDEKTTILLDGYPRTVEQMEAFWEKYGRNCAIQAIWIDVPTKALIERLSGRKYCTQCQTTYPPDKESCEKCRIPLIIREDDKEKVVAARLSVYETQTAPLLSWLSHYKLLQRIDGNLTPSEVALCIEQALES